MSSFAAAAYGEESQSDVFALKLHRGATFGGVSIALPHSNNGAIPRLPANGTAIAVNYLTLGGAPHLPANTGRGGARNRSERESYALSAKQVHNLQAAAAHAQAIGLPFTRMITIHWMAAGLRLHQMAEATGRFIDLLTKALARHGSATAWIWVHENGDNKGGHCHLLVHVPAALVQLVMRLQKRWLRRITSHPYRSRVILSKPVGGRLGVEVSNPDLHAVNLSTALSYLLKEASEAASIQFNLNRLEPGGRVIGKRCGTSQNIGAKARSIRDESDG